MVRKYQKTEYKQWSDDDIATLIEFYPNTKILTAPSMFEPEEV